MNSFARAANFMKLRAHDVLICAGKSPGLWKILREEEQYDWKLNTCTINFNIVSCQLIISHSGSWQIIFELL